MTVQEVLEREPRIRQICFQTFRTKRFVLAVAEIIATGKLQGMNTNSGISAGGRERLRDAIDKQVRIEFEQELAATTEYWARADIEKKITDEVERRMKEIASPQSLWGAS